MTQLESDPPSGQGAARPSDVPPSQLSPIRVIVADDHPMLVEGLMASINREPDLTVVAWAGNGRDAVDLYARLTPDVAVLDLRMPVMGGIEAIVAIRAVDPQARLIVFSSFASDEEIFQAIHAGARCYLVKDRPSSELIGCIRMVAGGQTCIPPEIASKLVEREGSNTLTAREREVLALIAEGRGNREIGVALDVTEGTVKVHVNSILTKLGVASRTEAVIIAVRRGLVRIDE